MSTWQLTLRGWNGSLRIELEFLYQFIDFHFYSPCPPRDKKNKYKKEKQLTRIKGQQIAQICKDEVSKAKAQNELRLSTNAKNNKRSFFHYERNKKKVKE